MTEKRAETAAEERLFYERGGSWLWILVGPISAVTMLILQHTSGQGVQPMVPLVILVLVTAFLGIQLKAARIHTSVELTRDMLREGTEVTSVNQILGLFPEPEFTMKSGQPLEKWQTARVLGELDNVPRGRTAIGIRLSGDRIAQAWARNPRGLRAALSELIEARAE
ncbi:MAG: DUF3093 domain-containing protein [Mycobacterium sp.]|nr:DUF3093 domain-containing protein [Mycobacterium sp.]